MPIVSFSFYYVVTLVVNNLLILFIILFYFVYPASMSVRTYVHPSVHTQKVSPIRMKFGVQVEVDE